MSDWLKAFGFAVLLFSVVISVALSMTVWPWLMGVLAILVGIAAVTVHAKETLWP